MCKEYNKAITKFEQLVVMIPMELQINGHIFPLRFHGLLRTWHQILNGRC